MKFFIAIPEEGMKEFTHFSRVTSNLTRGYVLKFYVPYAEEDYTVTFGTKDSLNNAIESLFYTLYFYKDSNLVIIDIIKLLNIKNKKEDISYALDS